MMEYEKAEAVVVLFDQCEALCAGSCKDLANHVVDCNQSSCYDYCKWTSWGKAGVCVNFTNKL